jgi:hypothetical protein
VKNPRIVALSALLLGAVGIVLMSSWYSGSRVSELPLVAGPEGESDDPSELSAGILPGRGHGPSAPRRELMDTTAARPSQAVPDGSGAPEGAATLAELREFREYVDTTLSEIRQEQAAGKLRDIEKRVALLDDVILELDEQLDLNRRQSERLRSALLSRLDLEAEYLRKWECGMDEEILAELMASDRAAHFVELSEFLTGEQLKAYLSSRSGAGRGGGQGSRHAAAGG